MTHPPILALGFSEAGMLLRKVGVTEIAAVLSIHGRHEFPVEAEGVPHRLDLQFDDAEVPDPTDPQSVHRCWVRKKWAAENGRPLTPPTLSDAKAIVEFARAIRDVDGVVLCQCQGGISRSPAAALLCLATWTGKGREQDCIERLLRARPCIAPHQGLLAFGDALLDRDGRLVRAVQESRWRNA